MADQSIIAAPVRDADRIASLDVLRGIAVFGILLMNITAFGLLFQAYGNPQVEGGATGINLAVYNTVTVLFEGTMRGIFSLLFGAGIVLLTSRMEKAGAGLMTAEVHFRRMMWMLLFGVIHWALMLWVGEILMAYAICGLLLFAPRKLPPRIQLIAAGLLLAFSVVQANWDLAEASAVRDAALAAEEARAAGALLSEDEKGALAGWDEIRAHVAADEASAAAQRDWHSGSYWNAVTGQWDFAYEFQWTSLPKWLFTDMVPFMLIGMALLKLGVLGGGLAPRIYLGMLAVGYGIGIPLGLYEQSIVLGGQFGPIAMLQAGETYQFSRLAMVVGHLGLFLTIIRLGLLKAAQRGFAAVGKMALSNYLMQTVICTLLFYGFGFGLYGELQRYQLYFVVFAICAGEMAWSVVWLRYYRFGPFEWLWRSLTYWQLQPMRIAPADPPLAPVMGA